ncbi:MAG TPA: hypothetical protein VJV23_14150 [Candidatus Polarisedimenticolia bacterium]|nr:hypothetical protein [Candidatus Polarisedimenticolia bacterium]
MKRLLAALALFVAVIVVLRRLAGGARPRRGRRASHRGATELVRDRVCNTFLPADRAVRLAHDGETHFFCSEACRARFTSGLPGAAGRAS